VKFLGGTSRASARTTLANEGGGDEHHVCHERQKSQMRMIHDQLSRHDDGKHEQSHVRPARHNNLPEQEVCTARGPSVVVHDILLRKYIGPAFLWPEHVPIS
jgi:hypothetical protein